MRRLAWGRTCSSTTTKGKRMKAAVNHVRDVVPFFWCRVGCWWVEVHWGCALGGGAHAHGFSTYRVVLRTRNDGPPAAACCCPGCCSSAWASCQWRWRSPWLGGGLLGGEVHGPCGGELWNCVGDRRPLAMTMCVGLERTPTPPTPPHLRHPTVQDVHKGSRCTQEPVACCWGFAAFAAQGRPSSSAI